MSDLSFPLKLDINAVYLTVDDKIKLDISSYFHTNDIRILTPFLLLVYCTRAVSTHCLSRSQHGMLGTNGLKMLMLLLRELVRQGTYPLLHAFRPFC